MGNFLTFFSVEHRKWVFWGLLLICGLFIAQLPNIQIDTDPENMLPSDNPARIFHNQTKQTFSMYDSIVVGAVNQQGIYNPKSLAAIHSLSEFALGIEGVVKSDLMSVSTVDNITQEKNTAQEAGGSIRFEWMMKQPPQNNIQAKKIQQAIERLPLLFNTLVSEDGKAAAIYVPIVDKNQSYAIAKQLQQHIDSIQSDDEWHITGLPVAEDRFGYEMFIQMGISAPLAGLMIFILLWVFFRNIPFITAPMIVAMATVLITMGLLIGMGFTVHIMSSMIAIFLMPIAVVDSVHIMSEFSDRYKKGDNAKEVITEVMGHLFTPMLYTSITSTVGFLSLMLTPIPPVQIFGAFVGFGIMLAFILTIIFIPAYLVSLKPSTLDKLVNNLPDEQSSGLAAMVVKLGKLAGSHARLWMLGFAGVFVISLYGISLIQINDNPVRWFKPDHELRIADKVLNHHFAGTYDAFIVLESDSGNGGSKAQNAINTVISSNKLSNELVDWLKQQNSDYSKSSELANLIISIDDQVFSANENDSEILSNLLASLEEISTYSKTFLAPDNLDYIQNLQTHLLASGMVGKSNSLADVVKTVNRELHSGQARDYKLPNSANGVAQTLLQYQSSHRPNDLWHFATPDYQKSLIWLQLTSGDNQDMSAIIKLVDEYLIQNPLPDNIKLNWAGKAYINVAWQQAMVAGMVNSLMGAFVFVLIMMILLFRSFVYGLLAMLPLTLTITLIYGLIGWVGKDYDMPIAVLSALTLGLSVDFAIHFLERARATYRETGDLTETLKIMFEEPGRAIARNAIVIAVGFTPLLFAPLVPYITVGIFLASIMAISALVTLIMLPSTMTVLQRWIFK